MITKVKVQYFKQFEEQEFDLSNPVILAAGPNNSGKTTLLQALAVWSMGLQKWISERGATSKAKKRAGVPITRKDFTAIPLREMKLLWTNTFTSLKKDETEEGKTGFPRVMNITLYGKHEEVPWEFSLEFRYQSSEQIYVKPADENISEVPKEVKGLQVVHVPPFSGIGAEETRYDRPYQDLLIGQGKAGDILRNLLLEVHKQPGHWKELTEQIEDVFHYQLLPPEYEGRPFILCEYLRGVPQGKGKNGLAQLDIASAGSGFHQILLLLAFFYARPASILLLDEPDAHLHVILQKQIYGTLRRIASERKCQLVIATHSEVLIDNTSPELIISFYKKPHRLVSETDRDQIREALKRLSASDILFAERSSGILYLEGETDFDLLKAWAKVIGHPLMAWFGESPFWHINQGRNPKEAKGHLFALQALEPGMKGLLLLDGDNRGLDDREVAANGLTINRWIRYEAESYLFHPDALLRFIESRAEPLFVQAGRNFLEDQTAPAAFRNPLGDHDFLLNTPFSKTFLPELLKTAHVGITKSEYYLIAEQMKPEEIHREVTSKLDSIEAAFAS